MARGKVVGLVGSQFGSEAKGLVAYNLATQFQIHIRTGGPNAGHTFYHRGEKFVARSLPCGWVNPEAYCVIGPGAVVDLEVLKEELAHIQALGYYISSRIYIDRKAGIITRTQLSSEGGVAGYAHKNIGSTGEGVGLIRMGRINRQSLVQGDDRFAFISAADCREELDEIGLAYNLCDTAEWVNDRIDGGNNVLLEGTQGSGLSLVHGPWPYCTSADTNVGQMAVDAGISPSLVDETILVTRTHPIRVYGNSGPLP